MNHPHKTTEAADEIMAVAEIPVAATEPPISPAQPLSWLSLLLATVALGIGLWVGYQQHQSPPIKPLAWQQLTASLHAQQASLEQAQHHIKQQQALLQQQQQHIKIHFDRIQSLSDQHHASWYWPLKSSLSALQMAQWLLIYQQDIHSVLGLLDTIEERLKNIDDPVLAPVQAALATDRAKLQAVTWPRPSEQLKQLHALRTSLTSLVLKRSNAGTPATQPIHKINEAMQPLTWAYAKAQLIQALQQVVLIRRQSDQPRSAIHHRTIVEQNMLLWLQQAQWAVIHHNEAVYQHSLLSLQQWLQRYFERDEPHTRTMQSQIAALLKEPVSITIPEIGATQRAMDQLLIQYDGSTSSRHTGAAIT